MAKKLTGSFLSADRKNQVAYYIFEPEAPRAVIQLSHGMCEYVERYEPHAEYFCLQGFVFAGNDHLGHGKTAKNDGDFGYTVSADCMIEDLSSMTDLLKEKYPGLPIILLGHSMGSFLLREYMTKYSGKLSGAIISGTAGPGNPTALGKALCRLIALFKGDRHRSKLLYSMSNGGYSKAFGKDGPKARWLSRDIEIAEKYSNDTRSNFIFTVNGYISLFDILGRVSKPSWAKKINPDLPILMISGADDPVGSFGSGVKKIHRRLQDARIKDLSLVLFEGARHEPFNEIEPTKSEAYKTVTDWINARI